MIQLDLIPETRLEKRMEKRSFLKNKINQQYSYTTFEAISAESQKRNGSFDWLPSKEGQSIEQWWLDRINQQKNASSYTPPIPMGCFGVHENNDIKLDDTIRKYICNSSIHQEISYEGGGDSGEINSYGDTSNGSVAIGQDIEYVGYEVIDIKFSGWENNEGGDGRIIFNFKDQNLEIHHTNNVEDSFTEEIETLILR
jgi:hypothetical protein